MAGFDEDGTFGAPAKPKTLHSLGENLDGLSVDEIKERIGALLAEIERLKAAAIARESTKSAAAQWFKAAQS